MQMEFKIKIDCLIFYIRHSAQAFLNQIILHDFRVFIKVLHLNDNIYKTSSYFKITFYEVLYQVASNLLKVGSFYNVHTDSMF